MTYETIITITCLILAATVLTVSFRFAHWRNRAEKAERLSTSLSREVSLRRSPLLVPPARSVITQPEPKSYGESIRERFDASTLTFAGFNTAAEMDVDTLGHFVIAVKNGHIAEMLNKQIDLIRQIDNLKGGAK